jgi:hypothetical protein
VTEATSSRNPDRPASKKAVETLNRLAERHGRPPAKVGISASEASDAIRWLATRLRPGQEHAPVPVEDPELQPGYTLGHWNTGRPGTRKAGEA